MALRFVPVEERPTAFTAPKNAFIIPSKPLIEVVKPGKRESVVAVPVKQITDPNIKITVCASVGSPEEEEDKKEARKLARKQKIVQIQVGEKKVRQSSNKESVVQEKASEVRTYLLPRIDPKDIVSDVEFIKRTRGKIGSRHGDGSGSIHDPEVKNLFFANGGCEMIQGVPFFMHFETLAGAFESLRRRKLEVIAGIQGEEYRRHKFLKENEIEVFVPGMNKDRDFATRQQALVDARKREDNNRWLNKPIAVKYNLKGKKVA